MKGLLAFAMTYGAVILIGGVITGGESYFAGLNVGLVGALLASHVAAIVRKLS